MAATLGKHGLYPQAAYAGTRLDPLARASVSMAQEAPQVPTSTPVQGAISSQDFGEAPKSAPISTA